MASGNGNHDFRQKGPAKLTVGLLLSLALAGIATAASNGGAPCERIAKDLQSLDVRVGDLSLGIDKTSGSTNQDIADAIDQEAMPQNPPAPMLFLTPRVASILEAVFDNHQADRQIDGESANADVVQDTDDTTAEGAGAKSAPVTVIDLDGSVPRFQRHMYRKDI